MGNKATKNRRCHHKTILYPTGGTEYWSHDTRTSCDIALSMRAMSNSGCGLGNSGWKLEQESPESIIRNELVEE